jgi:hypothetical protein
MHLRFWSIHKFCKIEVGIDFGLIGVVSSGQSIQRVAEDFLLSRGVKYHYGVNSISDICQIFIHAIDNHEREGLFGYELVEILRVRSPRKVLLEYPFDCESG